MSNISDLLKVRVTKPTAGKWCSGFSAAKKYADDNDMPFIALWTSSGGTDYCSHCIDFEAACLTSTFKTWMSTSKCIFWLGCQADKAKSEDGYEGAGFMWTRGGQLTAYPFFRVWWKAGNVDKFEKGDYWLDSPKQTTTAKRASALVTKLKNLLKKYTSSLTSTTTSVVSSSSTAETITTLVLTQQSSNWSIDTSSGRFLGYKNPSTGFAGAFQILKDYADTRNLPIAIVWANHGSATVNTIVKDINDGSDYTGDRYTLQLLNEIGAAYGTPAGKGNRLDITAQPGYGFRAGWFQGSANTVGDCGEARQFCIDCGCSQSLDIMVALYWKYPDGTIYSSVSSKNFTTESALMSFIVAWLKSNTYSKHKDKPLKPRRLAPRKDIFDPTKVVYDVSKNLYNAGDTSRNSAVEIGIWNGNLQIVLDKADSENTPVLVMFGVANCGSHWNVLQSDAFVKWQLSCNMYLSYCKGSWNKGGYSERWIETKTFQGQASPGSSFGDVTYHCPEYAVHWKPASGAEINIGKYTTSKGDTPTGLTINPEVIEGFLSGYFSEYQPLNYSETTVKADQQQSFTLFGRGAPQRIDNKLANKTTYSIRVPYKNLDNIKAFCENYDRPLVAIYFNSSASGSNGLVNALNLGTTNSNGGLDQWLGLEDTAILWCDVASQDGGKATLGAEWQTWIADLNKYPERASDKWAFRFYLKAHNESGIQHSGVDVSYSFQQIYDKVYDADRANATQKFIQFLTEIFEPYYKFIEYTKNGVFFTVDFIDYDGTEIVPQQTVMRGLDAIPPSQTPSRSGYTFTGYSQPYTNVQQNLTCVAQYVQSGSSTGYKSQYFAEHTYASGSYQMRISDNLSAVQVVGDMRQNGMTSQLTSVTFQQNLFQIMPSCFMNCERLKSVDVTGQTKWIGDYAFSGCQNLTHVNALTYPKQTQINIIGAHAFHGTGLTDIAIDLTASYYDTGIGEQAFADCTQLKSVMLTNSAYLGQAAFAGCTALTSVQLPNKSSYAYPETFSGCISLSSISIPAKVWMLNDGMFRNCRALTAVDIQDTADNKSLLDRLGSEVFYGCDSLTSLVVPSSITSLVQINENFLQGSSIKKITFNGLSDDVFVSKYTEQHNYKTENGYITTMAQAKKAIKDALDRHIPMVLVTCKKSIKDDVTSDCGFCKKLAKMLTSKTWLSYMDSHKNNCYFIEASYQKSKDFWWMITDTSSPKDNPLKGVYENSNTLYAKLFAVYKGTDGKVKTAKWSSNETDVNKLISSIDKVVSKVGGQVINETHISAMVSKFGSPFDYILAYSSTGKEYKLSSNSQVEKYIAPEVDMTTTSGFKTGVWYYNAKELKDYADSAKLPAFVEFSDYGCTPCTKFRTEIYERQEFQEWVAKQPYLFCRIETTNFGEFDRMFTQPYFVRHTWAKGGSVGLPCFIFYWNREQNPVWEMFGYHDNQISYSELIDMITQKFKS